MRPTFLALPAALLMGALMSAPALAQVKLERKYTEGSKVTEQTTIHFRQVLTLAGMDVESDVDQVITTSQTVGAKKSDGSTPIEVEISGLKANMALPGGISINFDSAEPPQEVDPQLKFITDMLKALTGARYTVLVDSKGKAQSVDGAQSIIDKANELDPKAGESLQSRLRLRPSSASGSKRPTVSPISLCVRENPGPAPR